MRDNFLVCRVNFWHHKNLNELKSVESVLLRARKWCSEGSCPFIIDFLHNACPRLTRPIYRRS